MFLSAMIDDFVKNNILNYYRDTVSTAFYIKILLIFYRKHCYFQTRYFPIQHERYLKFIGIKLSQKFRMFIWRKK